MKRLLILLIISLSTQAQAKGERIQVDKNCLKSDTLRVEIGGERFAFPRKLVHSLSGDDVINVKGDAYKGNATGTKACQKPTTPIWNIEYLSLYMYPKGMYEKQCNTERGCRGTSFKINVTIKNLSDYREAIKEWPNGAKVYPNTKKELLEKCVPPKSPYSDFHERVWSICNFVFNNSKQNFTIKFRGGIYHPENIEHTKQLVLDEVYKYQINSKNNKNRDE